MSSSWSDEVVPPLSPPDRERLPRDRLSGLAATAGELAEWEDLREAVDEIYSSRRSARDRDAPDLDQT